MSLFDSLHSAALLMVRQEGFDIDQISFTHLANTYRTTPERAREIVQIAMNGSRKLPEEVAAAGTAIPKSEEIEE
jgi:hypothetical protein